MLSILSILSIFFSITSCSEEGTEQEQNLIFNQWDLIKYEPGFSPTENFNSGQVLWDFQKNNILVVKVDNSVATPPLKTEGSYEYTIIGNRISIDNKEYDFSLNYNILTISDDPSSDGFKATFTRRTE